MKNNVLGAEKLDVENLGQIGKLHIFYEKIEKSENLFFWKNLKNQNYKEYEFHNTQISKFKKHWT